MRPPSLAGWAACTCVAVAFLVGAYVGAKVTFSTFVRAATTIPACLTVWRER